LWQSDGTSAGTTLVKDIRSGNSGSAPRYLTNVNGKLFFTAIDGVSGFELWKSDGTSAGTTLVKDIRSGGNTSSSSPGSLTNVNGTLFISATDGTNGYELWSMLVNSRPQLTAFAAVLDTTNEDTQVELTFAEFLAQGDESDVDGAVEAFVVQAVSSGSLKIGTSALNATAFAVGSNDKINATLNAYWTPAANAHGNAIAALTVLAQDNLGLTSILPITANIIVNPVNDPASTLILTPSSANIAEDASTSSATTLATITVTDDTQGTNVLSLTGTDAASFEIVSSELRLKSGVVLDFETQQTYTVNVEVDDATVGGNPDASATFTLYITDVNEVPTAASLQNTTTSLPENTSTATAIKVADISVTDDALGTNVLSLNGSDRLRNKGYLRRQYRSE
jgi:ELWxxDGT repeat protein